NAPFSVNANSLATLYYEWFLNGTNLAGATDASYTRFAAQPSDAGAYSVIVSNSVNTATSSNAFLTVIIPPVISVQPVSQLVAISNTANFSVGLTQRTRPMSQWLKHGFPLEDTSSYRFPVAQA